MTYKESPASLSFEEVSATVLPPAEPPTTTHEKLPDKGEVHGVVPSLSAIEDPDFPFEHLSEIAELESWRKEVNRPVYHIHKWWAQRLGSVFRALLIGAFKPRGADVLKLFYEPTRLPGSVVFDPFMGSGTTVGEALKLGARAIGRDINPVAHFAVSNALSRHPREEILKTFEEIKRDVLPEIRRFYQVTLPEGGAADVLYYFWVKVVACPECERDVDLFSSYIFAQNAYPKKKPEARILCPNCGEIDTARYDAQSVTCRDCWQSFDPQSGPARKTSADCPHCRHTFQIAKAVRRRELPPDHHLYAKLVLQADGEKRYLRADDHDRALYEEATRELQFQRDAFPVVAIEAGHNTDQALNYGYRYWHQMFNDRQLYCLSVLAARIRRIEDETLRNLFTCLFSGTLEFNNMFASYKGEGTGAVRPMFAHHILKPERTPLEANPWGTRKSSGAFSTLLESRLLKVSDYCADPFEVRPVVKDGKIAGEKVFGLSHPLAHRSVDSYADFSEGAPLYLSCGDSSRTDIRDGSVDAVVTDPPFFDNVHYSQLADFFHVWQRHILGSNGHQTVHTTRSAGEVQRSDPAQFAERLGSVWRECHRVLKPGGLLVFTYHHSKPEGWRAVLQALAGAGFYISATHPIKAEMSVAAPKSQAKEPIDLDVIIICRKAGRITPEQTAPTVSGLVSDGALEAAAQVRRFNETKRHLSRNDVRVVVMAQLLKRLSLYPLSVETLAWLDAKGSPVEDVIGEIHAGQKV